MCEIKYSFIIPHRNAPDLLARCLASIPERDDLEIIVVDDDSRDELVPVATHSRQRIIRIDSSESKGAGHARNVGMDDAGGRWLLFADCDDFYENGFLDELDRFRERDLDVVMFGAHVDYSPGEPGMPETVSWYDKMIERYQASPKSHEDTMRLLLGINSPWCKMFRREFVRSCGERFEEIPIGNDAAFALNVSSRAKRVEVVPNRLYYYVLNNNGITRKKRPICDYYKEIDSQNRLNLLKDRCGVADTITLPGFNKKSIIRDYGKLTFFRLYLYKIMNDPTFIKTLYLHIRRKFSLR